MLRGTKFILTAWAMLALFWVQPSSGQLKTTKHVVDSKLNGAHWVFATDVDRDGDLDIVAAATDDDLRWYSNNGNGGFAKRSVGSFTGAWGCYAKDVDGDGDVDMLGASSRLHEIAWWEKKGGFTKHVVESNFNSAEAVFAADLDDDGDNDILGTAWGDDVIAWWENKGGNSFTKHVLASNFTGAHSVFAADLDKDGDVDIVGSAATKTWWWRNNGKGSFSQKSVGSGGALNVFVADIDGDGDNDILRTERANGNVEWFKNNGSGGFSKNTVQSAFGNSWSVAAGDIDGDGDMDVTAAAFLDGHIDVWLNNGKEKFTNVVLEDNLKKPRGVYAADFDRDGDADIAAVIAQDDKLVWYEVTGGGSAAPTLTVTQPDGGENLAAGSTFTIKWKSTGAIDNVKIEFSADDGANWSTVTSNTTNDGRFDWQVPDTPSSFALIRISDASGGVPSDVSDASFAIVQEFSLTVTAPNGNESWGIGSVQKVKWSSVGIDNANLKIEYSIDGGGSWLTVVNSTSNDGSYSWTIPDTPSPDCLVRVSETTSGGLSDVSDGVFSIVEVTPKITVVAPNGGEVWSVGSTQQIEWNATGSIDSVQIDFSADDGLQWTLIAAQPNQGSYDWRVPNTLSDNCLVRVTSLSSAAAEDVSDGVFSIVAQQLYSQRVNAGGPAYVDREGQVWQADQAFTKGSWGFVEGRVSTTQDPISNTPDDVLYQSERFGVQEYNFTVPEDGRYLVDLHFAEVFLTEVGQRVFDVTIENDLVLNDLDIIAEVGHDAALVKSFEVEVTDGVLNIEFTKEMDRTKISAIAVSRIVPDTTAPLISNVGTADLTSRRVTINWETDEASDSQIEYGTSSVLERSTPIDSDLVTSHQMLLTHLRPNTVYYYRVLSRDGHSNLATSAEFSFTTSSPEDWLTELADDILRRNPDPAQLPFDDWKISVRMQGLMRAFEATGNPAYFDYLQRWVDAYVDEAGHVPLNDQNPDLTAGMVVLALYEVTEEGKYLQAAQSLVDHFFQFAARTSDEAFAHSPELADQLWCDSLNGFSLFLAKMTSVTGDSLYLNEGIKQVLLYASHLQDPQSGLFYHAWDEDGSAAWADPLTHRSPEFWGRGDGWVAVAISDLLDYVPRSYPGRDSLLIVFNRFIQGLISVQDDSAGLWYTVLNKGRQPGNYLETSGSAQIAYALARGIDGGYLDSNYLEPLNRAEVGLENRIFADSSGVVVTDVSEATVVGDFDYYVGRQVGTGLQYPYGEGAYLLARAAGREMTKHAARLLVESGEKQLAPINATLPVALKVRVVTAQGEPVAGAQVEFNILHGGGALSRWNEVVTTGEGTAWTRWTLGEEAGLQLVEVVSDVLDTSLVFTALAYSETDSVAPVIDAIELDSLGTTSVRITWVTDEYSDSQVEFGLDANYGQFSPLDSAFVVSHKILLSSLLPGQVYHYRIRSRDIKGNLAVSSDQVFSNGIVTDINPPVNAQIPDRFFLSQNYPNPFNLETSIEYGVPNASRVYLAIYNLQGRMVRVLVDKEQPAGSYSISWDGRDRSGQIVSSGVYIYRMRAEHYQNALKFLLLK